MPATVTWDPNDGSDGWPDDHSINFGSQPATPASPTLPEVNAVSGLNQIVGEVRRRDVELGLSVVLAYFTGVTLTGATFTTVRNAINAIRTQKLMAAYSWTNPGSYVGLAKAKQDLKDFRQALDVSNPVNGIWFGGTVGIGSGTTPILSGDASGIVWGPGNINGGVANITPIMAVIGTEAVGLKGYADLKLMTWTPYNGAASMSAVPFTLINCKPIVLASGRVMQISSLGVSYTDDGHTWSHITSLATPATLPPGTGPGATVASIHIAGRAFLGASNRIIITGYVTTNFGSLVTTMWHSDDEGVTWSNAYPPEWANTNSNLLQGTGIVMFSQFGNHYIIQDYFFTGGSSQGWKSTDNGLTWNSYPGGFSSLIQIRNGHHVVELASGRILAFVGGGNGSSSQNAVYTDNLFISMTTLASKFGNLCVVGNRVYALLKPTETTSGFYEIWYSDNECASFSLFAITTMNAASYSRGLVRADMRTQ